MLDNPIDKIGVNLCNSNPPLQIEGPNPNPLLEVEERKMRKVTQHNDPTGAAVGQDDPTPVSEAPKAAPKAAKPKAAAPKE